MLTPSTKTGPRAGRGERFAIIASKYNPRYVEGMLRGALAVFRKAGVEQIKVVRVPGAFEIPVVAASLARQGDGAWSGVICLGVILRGATTHAQHIGESVSAALVQIQVTHCLPVIHEVLLLESEQQAEERCLSRQHNRGAEAASTALAMAATMRRLRGEISKRAV